MFLSAVVLILQEILEAALLISVMLMFTHLFNQLWRGNFALTRYWVIYSIVCGGVASWLLAHFTPEISVWFDYVGQEVVNAGIHILSLSLLLGLAFIVPAARLDKAPVARSRLIGISMAGIVMLSIMREGSEILLYLLGFVSQPENINAVIFGGVLGAGIGFSIGILLFYGLVSLSAKWAFRTGLVLLCLIAGNMASQVVLLLNQADWVPYTPALWNSAALIPEASIVGRLLYALVGYEATPSLAQVACYVAGIVVIASSPLSRRLWGFSTARSPLPHGVM